MTYPDLMCIKLHIKKTSLDLSLLKFSLLQLFFLTTACLLISDFNLKGFFLTASITQNQENAFIFNFNWYYLNKKLFVHIS